MRKDLDFRHYDKIREQADHFMKEYSFFFTTLQYSVANDINFQYVGIQYDELRAYAFVSMMFIKECQRHENKMTELIKSRIGEAKKSHLPTLDALYTCMDAYLGNCEIKETQNMRNNMAVFQKNLNEIEFELKD